MEKLKVIITGSTGMVGEGVLHECLAHSGYSPLIAKLYNHPEELGISHD